jgi:hypothetical protein
MTSHLALAAQDGHAIMERVIATGDLAQLTPEERNRYYILSCQSLGLNFLTRPFEYLKLNGKLVLYAKRDAADQLRKINGISLRIKEQRTADGLFLVTIEAQDKDGRVDTDVGAVALGNLQGEARANAILKGITKAKRRVTLSICGLGMLDETEVADIPAGERQAWEEPKPALAVDAPSEPEPAKAGVVAFASAVAAKPAEITMQTPVRIFDLDGVQLHFTSLPMEAAQYYRAAQKRSRDPGMFAVKNIDVLRALEPHMRNGSLARLRQEIEAAEAKIDNLERERRALEDADNADVDEDGVVREDRRAIDDDGEPGPA